MKKFLIICVLLVTTLNARSQAQEDAWVFFTDKEDVEVRLANPISILTQEAIDRKNMHNTPIDERDVPVNEAYISTVKQQNGITVLAKSKWFNCVHVRGTENAIQELRSLAFVLSIDFANRNITRSSDSFGFVKEAPQPKKQVDYNYGQTEVQTTMLGLETLHQQDYTGEGMVIAVLDAGFPGVDTAGGFERLREEGRLLDGYDFVDREDNEFAFSGTTHGTRVSSTIVGFIEDQFVGAAPQVSLYCFRTEDVASENPVEESYWVEAAERADSLGVDIINSSLGYRNFDNPAYSYTYDDMNGETAFISRGATQAFQKGMLVVTSAGNSGLGMITAPGDSQGAITVGAVDGNGDYASFSSIGPSSDGRVKPDVMARGMGSAVIDNNNNIISNNGTSFSSPITAGAIASLWQVDPTKTNEEIIRRVQQTAHLFPESTPQLGFGIPDFSEALAQLEEPLGVANNNAFAKGLSIFPNPASTQLEISIPQFTEAVDVVIYDLVGKQVQTVKIAEERTTIDISKLNRGIYLVHILGATQVSPQKLIVR